MPANEAPELVPVEQVDRDAAADVHHFLNDGDTMAEECMRDGRYDDDPRVQAFARHRINASRPVGAGVSEQAREIWDATPHADGCASRIDTGGEWLACDCDRSIRAIEAALFRQPAPVEVADLCARLRARTVPGPLNKVDGFGRDRKIDPLCSKAADLIERLAALSEPPVEGEGRLNA